MSDHSGATDFSCSTCKIESPLDAESNPTANDCCGCEICSTGTDKIARASAVLTSRDGTRTWVAGLALTVVLEATYLTPAWIVSISATSVTVSDAPLFAAVIVGGASIGRTGLAALRERTDNIDVLETIAIVAAVSLGMFIEAALLSVLISLNQRLKSWLTLASPSETWSTNRRRSLAYTEAPVEDVETCEIVAVHPGECIPSISTNLFAICWLKILRWQPSPFLTQLVAPSAR